MPKLTIDKAITEWESTKRHMGCVSAADWFCARVAGFKPIRIERWTEAGDIFEHVVASDGRVIIDLSPYADHPEGEGPGPYRVYRTPWRELQARWQ